MPLIESSTTVTPAMRKLAKIGHALANTGVVLVGAFFVLLFTLPTEGRAQVLITVLAFGVGSLALAMILGIILRIWMNLVVAVRMAKEERKRLGKS